MSDHPSSVPRIPKSAMAHEPPVRLTFPSRYNARFPAPDDEPFQVDQVEFAAQYFACVIGLTIAIGAFSAFVLVPLVGQLLSH
jgi:cobalamin biosynthesis protein CobD/CbiB